MEPTLGMKFYKAKFKTNGPRTSFTTTIKTKHFPQRTRPIS